MALNPILLQLAVRNVKRANENDDQSQGDEEQPASQTPPNLTDALPGALETCKSCKYMDQSGLCSKYNYPVQPTQVCNSWEAKEMDLESPTNTVTGAFGGNVTDTPGSVKPITQSVPEPVGMDEATTSLTKASADRPKDRVRVVMPYEGKYLLEELKNPAYPQNLGRKRFVGGGVERGETHQQAAARELQEELSLSHKPEDFSYLGHDPVEQHMHYLELKNHTLKPGQYKANKGSDPIIHLVHGDTSDPNYWGAKLDALKRPASPLDRMKELKMESDRGNYPAKHAIIRNLLHQHPNDFTLDSDQGHTVGITHPKTGFRFHTLRTSLPTGWPPKPAPEPAVPQMPELVPPTLTEPTLKMGYEQAPANQSGGIDSNIGGQALSLGVKDPKPASVMHWDSEPNSCTKAEYYRTTKGLNEGEVHTMPHQQLSEKSAVVHLYDLLVQATKRAEFPAHNLMGTGSIMPPKNLQATTPRPSLTPSRANPLVDPHAPQAALAQQPAPQGAAPVAPQPQPLQGVAKLAQVFPSALPVSPYEKWTHLAQVLTQMNLKSAAFTPVPPPNPSPLDKIAAAYQAVMHEAAEGLANMAVKGARRGQKMKESEPGSVLSTPVNGGLGIKRANQATKRADVRRELNDSGGSPHPQNSSFAEYFGNRSNLLDQVDLYVKLGWQLGNQYNRDNARYEAWQKPPFVLGDQYNRDRSDPVKIAQLAKAALAPTGNGVPDDFEKKVTDAENRGDFATVRALRQQQEQQNKIGVPGGVGGPPAQKPIEPAARNPNATPAKDPGWTSAAGTMQTVVEPSKPVTSPAANGGFTGGTVTFNDKPAVTPPSKNQLAANEAASKKFPSKPVAYQAPTAPSAKPGVQQVPAGPTDKPAQGAAGAPAPQPAGPYNFPSAPDQNDPTAMAVAKRNTEGQSADQQFHDYATVIGPDGTPQHNPQLEQQLRQEVKTLPQAEFMKKYPQLGAQHAAMLYGQQPQWGDTTKGDAQLQQNAAAAQKEDPAELQRRQQAYGQQGATQGGILTKSPAVRRRMLQNSASSAASEQQARGQVAANTAQGAAMNKNVDAAMGPDPTAGTDWKTLASTDPKQYAQLKKQQQKYQMDRSAKLREMQKAGPQQQSNVNQLEPEFRPGYQTPQQKQEAAQQQQDQQQQQADNQANNAATGNVNQGPASPQEGPPSPAKPQAKLTVPPDAPRKPAAPPVAQSPPEQPDARNYTPVGLYAQGLQHAVSGVFGAPKRQPKVFPQRSPTPPQQPAKPAAPAPPPAATPPPAPAGGTPPAGGDSPKPASGTITAQQPKPSAGQGTEPPIG